MKMIKKTAQSCPFLKLSGGLTSGRLLCHPRNKIGMALYGKQVAGLKGQFELMISAHTLEYHPQHSIMQISHPDTRVVTVLTMATAKGITSDEPFFKPKYIMV